MLETKNKTKNKHKHKIIINNPLTKAKICYFIYNIKLYSTTMQKTFIPRLFLS